MTNIKNCLSHFELLEVLKPARYLGGEVNEARLKKNFDLRVCLVFPDLYELGMSNLAIKIFYESLNALPNVMAERAFAPWPDFEGLLRKKNLPLYALESGTPLKEFDALFITLPYEMTYTNVLNILDLSQIELLVKNRSGGPIVFAGGPSSANPLPLSSFIDVFHIGDGEEAVIEICQRLIECKKANCSRAETKKALLSIEGIWSGEYPARVTRRVFSGFSKSAPPLKPIVPNLQTTHNRAALEILRGCVNGCRFCSAGFYYRPKRERSVSDLLNYAKELLKNTGEETIGLLSLSTSDYTHLSELIRGFDKAKLCAEQNISIPSLRMNNKTIELLNESQSVRRGGLTFAPEAGSQRLRDIINKNIREEDIIDVMRATSSSEYRTVKLYFMIGLPFETDDDVLAIAALCQKLNAIARACKPKKQLSISLSGFVPKVFTPFQWAGQNSPEELQKKRIMVCKNIDRSCKISWRDEFLCRLEAILSRGDEKVGNLLLQAHKNGCKFDGWFEYFSREKWQKAFEKSGINALDYTTERSLTEELPQSFIDFRVPNEYLKQEYEKAKALAQQNKL